MSKTALTEDPDRIEVEDPDRTTDLAGEPTQVALDRTLKPATAVEGESAEEKADRQNAVRTAYSKATTRLREENLNEFNRLQREEAAKLGYDWSPAPTKAEKAKAEIERLISENPELAQVYGKFEEA